MKGAAPIRAFHSSPHDFDRFDLNRIGTGEGAQVYGHGIYAAESPKVSGQGGEYWNQFRSRFSPAEQEATNILQNHNFDRKAAIAELERLKTYHPGYLAGATDNFDRIKRGDIIAKTNDALAILKREGPVGPRTYEVNINARPDLFLDWDKPLAQQPAGQAAMGVGKQWLYGNNQITGEDLYRGIAAVEDKRATSEALRAAGIPGIRYLDQGSRGVGQDIARLERELEVAKIAKQTPYSIAYLEKKLADARARGDPTSNYVVFDPNLIDIVKKYGIAGVPAAGALGSVVAPDRYRQ